MHVIRIQKYLELDFTGDQGPLVIPYQCAGFWWGIYDQSNIGYNQSIQIAKALNNISWGVTWMHGDITTELYAITRERLIQQGSTNYKTFDFETSQNLFMAEADRERVDISFTQANQMGPNVYHLSSINLFDVSQDRNSRIEIPQRMMHTKRINFSKLSHNYAFRPQDFSNPMTGVAYQIPGPQCWIGDQNGKLGFMTAEGELYNDLSFSGAMGYSNQFFWERRSYPCLMYGQPDVTDETGKMKFRYQIKFTTELYLKFHFLPSYYTQEPFLKRQSIELPQWFPNDQSPKGTVNIVVCLPYEANT